MCGYVKIELSKMPEEKFHVASSTFTWELTWQYANRIFSYTAYVLLSNAIPDATSVDAVFSAWLALIVVDTYIGAFGLFAFKLGHVTYLATCSAVLIFITIVT